MIKKQTKIVATISDRKCDTEFIKKMHDSGVDIIRLNTAHQNLKDTLKVITNIRKVSERLGILIDTKGPEVRISEVPEDLNFCKGDRLKLSGATNASICSGQEIFVNYHNFHNEVPVGSSVFIDDGKLELKVRKKNKTHIICEVMNDGVIKTHKSVNVPGVHLQLEALSKKDKEYIDFSVKHNIDFIAHSFVRSKEDVMAIKKILQKKKSQIKIIAKIENIEGVNNLNEILEHADGAMVARGDLGIEIAPEEIPLIQKNIIRRCMHHRKPVIVATQMLQSMVKNPRPTRAEVSDVANAVIDGADAVMLSEESASGDYPVESVEIMSRIVRRVELSNEKCCSCNLPSLKSKNTPADYLIKAAIQATNELDIKEIIMTAKNDFTAEAIASHRGRIPVYVKCFDKTVVRQLGLIFGVNAHYVPKEENHKKFLTSLFKNLVKKGKLTVKDKVVFLGSDLNNGSEANFMEICEVGKYVNEGSTAKK